MFLQRVRKPLKKHGLVFQFLQKSEKSAQEFENKVVKVNEF